MRKNKNNKINATIIENNGMTIEDIIMYRQKSKISSVGLLYLPYFVLLDIFFHTVAIIEGSAIISVITAQKP